MAFEGAILDFDGTLVDSIDAWHDLEGVLAREAQATVTLEDRKQLIPMSLDEIAQWVASDGVERSEEESVDELWRALGLTRRGAQTDAVLRHVVRRNTSAK